MSKTTLELFEIRKSWSEAVEKSKSYKDPDLVTALLCNFATNSPCVLKPVAPLNSRVVELFAAVLYSLKQFPPAHTTVRVADIGGGNGYMAYQISKLLPDRHFVWNVYESPRVAAAYSNLIGLAFPINLKLNFVSSDSLFDGNEGGSEIDLILISCALQYFERPYRVLDEVFKFNCPKIIMRITFVDLSYDISVIQNFEKLGGYAEAKSVSLPMWWFSRMKFMAFIAENEVINYSWVTDSESYRFMSRDIPLEGLVCGCR